AGPRGPACRPVPLDAPDGGGEVKSVAAPGQVVDLPADVLWHTRLRTQWRQGVSIEERDRMPRGRRHHDRKRASIGAERDLPALPPRLRPRPGLELPAQKARAN